ncbi:MAG: S-adenosylmethionine:tRNA ribosyltransferase-isomerase, partial [Acidimicrobiia bacterium]
VRPGRKMKPGETLHGDDGVPVLVVHGRGDKGDTFRVEFVHHDPQRLIERLGEMPLPPYITQRLGDQSRYQTVYARDAKSAAAPTAGLHFTPELLAQIRAMGVATVSVELVVGLDTFAPVTVDDPRDHVIHTESYHVPAETLAAVETARRVVAVGTTATRALESVAATGKISGRTDLFITPGFEFRHVDVLLTNFHMPRTTLLLMISAFVGERWRRLYEHAVRNEYRFFSFGDAMLLDRSLE